jgi:hypothetical protein
MSIILATSYHPNALNISIASLFSHFVTLAFPLHILPTSPNTVTHIHAHPSVFGKKLCPNVQS